MPVMLANVMRAQEDLHLRDFYHDFITDRRGHERSALPVSILISIACTVVCDVFFKKYFFNTHTQTNTCFLLIF